MATIRGLIFAALKGVEPDSKRALAIADYLATEYRRHPQAQHIYSLRLEGPPRLLPPTVSKVTHGEHLWVSITHTPRRDPTVIAERAIFRSAQEFAAHLHYGVRKARMRKGGA